VIYERRTSGRGEDEMPFYIQSVQSGKYLDVEGGSSEQGAKVITWDFHGGKNQQWSYRNGMIVSKSNGLVLDITGARETGEIIVWSEHGGNNQKWHFDEDFTIRSELGIVLDVKHRSMESGANLIAFPKHGDDNQKFRIVPVEK